MRNKLSILAISMILSVGCTDNQQSETQETNNKQSETQEINNQQTKNEDLKSMYELYITNDNFTDENIENLKEIASYSKTKEEVFNEKTNNMESVYYEVHLSKEEPKQILRFLEKEDYQNLEVGYYNDLDKDYFLSVSSKYSKDKNTLSYTFDDISEKQNFVEDYLKGIEMESKLYDKFKEIEKLDVKSLYKNSFEEILKDIEEFSSGNEKFTYTNGEEYLELFFREDKLAFISFSNSEIGIINNYDETMNFEETAKDGNYYSLTLFNLEKDKLIKLLY